MPGEGVHRTLGFLLTDPRPEPQTRGAAVGSLAGIRPCIVATLAVACLPVMMPVEREQKTECVIVINCGSSSLKVALLGTDGSGNPLLKGLAERLGTEDAVLKVETENERETVPIPFAGHREALQAFAERMKNFQPVAVGHRVVHGGEEFTGSVRITSAVIDAVQRCASLAPLHNPANLIGIQTAQELFPGLPHVAVFDTAFHQSLPPHAFLYAVPYHFYEDMKVRRYGFHGTSHQFVSCEAAGLLGKTPEETSLITMHLGNGCSACAVKEGRSVDSTMGLTPSEGLVMGTRSGDVDPALHQFLHDRTGMPLGEITALINSQSGLLGLSGLSNDMRTLAQASLEGNERAALAIEVFCYRLAKAVCGLTAALKRLDALVFTGGIGENSALVRERVADHWTLLGVRLDSQANAAHGRQTRGLISTELSNLKCLVVPTNEELMIARETLKLLN